MKPFRFLLDEAVAVFMADCSKREQTSLIRVCDSIAAEPEQPHDSLGRDHVGHPLKKKRFAKWEIAWWVDAPVYQVQIVECRRIG